MNHLAAIVGTAALSFSAIWYKWVAVSPATAAVFRCAYAVPVLAALWLARRGRDDRRRRERWMAFGAGVLLSVDLLLWHASVDRIGAGPGTVLANLQVLVVGLAAWILHKERPRLVILGALPVIAAGVACLSGLGGADAYGDAPAAGIAFGCGAAAAYSGYLLLIRHSNRRSRAPTAGPLLDATLGAATGAILLAPLDPGFAVPPTADAHLKLLGLALTAQGIGWWCVAYALPRLPAVETSVLLLCQPAMTVLWGFLLFAEHLSGVQWLGVGLILGGVATVSLTGARRGPGPVTPDGAPAEAG